MSDKFITITVPAANQSLAQDLAEAMGQEGLFTAALYFVSQVTHNSVTGPLLAPGTLAAHISTGMVPEDFANTWLAGPGAIYDAAVLGGFSGSSAQVAALWNEFYCFVSELQPSEVQILLGLSINNPNEEV